MMNQADMTKAKALLDAIAAYDHDIRMTGQEKTLELWEDSRSHMCRAIKRSCPDYKEDKDMIMALARAGGLSGWTVATMPQELRQDREVAATVLNCRVNLLDSDKQAFIRPFTDDKGMMLTAIYNGVAEYADASPRLQMDVDVAVASLNADNPDASLQAIKPDLFHDKEFVMCALDCMEPDAVRPYLPDDMLHDPDVWACLDAEAPGLDDLISDAKGRAGNTPAAPRRSDLER